MEAADAAEPETAWRRRAVCGAARDWALAHRAEFALVFGSPVPDYRAPADTVAPAARALLALVRVVADTFTARALRTPAAARRLPAELGRQLGGLAAEISPDLPPKHWPGPCRRGRSSSACSVSNSSASSSAASTRPHRSSATQSRAWPMPSACRRPADRAAANQPEDSNDARPPQPDTTDPRPSTTGVPSAADPPVNRCAVRRAGKVECPMNWDGVSGERTTSIVSAPAREHATIRCRSYADRTRPAARSTSRRPHSGKRTPPAVIRVGGETSGSVGRTCGRRPAPSMG